MCSINWCPIDKFSLLKTHTLQCLHYIADHISRFADVFFFEKDVKRLKKYIYLQDLIENKTGVIAPMSLKKVWKKVSDMY